MDAANESLLSLGGHLTTHKALLKYLFEKKMNDEANCELQSFRELSLVIEKPLSENFVYNLTRLQLEKLHLAGNYLPDTQVKVICNMSSLKDLDISCFKVMVEDILHLHKLEELHIAMPFIKNEHLEQLLMGLPHLRAIYLRSSPFITEEFIENWKRSNGPRSPNLQISLNQDHLIGPLISLQ